MVARLLAAARATNGFLLESEGLALHAAGVRAGRLGPLLEIGSYCGKSAVYLGAAARATGALLFSIDHHRGSEEQQPGQGYFDPRLAGPDGRVDSLPHFRQTIAESGLEDVVIAVVGVVGAQDAATSNYLSWIWAASRAVTAAAMAAGSRLETGWPAR